MSSIGFRSHILDKYPLVYLYISPLLFWSLIAVDMDPSPADIETAIITNPIIEQQSVERERDPGIFPTISASTISAATIAMLRPLPTGPYNNSNAVLIVVYNCITIMLFVLGILLFGITIALAVVPQRWVRVVRAIATTVTWALLLLLLLLLLVAFATYRLVH